MRKSEELKQNVENMRRKLLNLKKKEEKISEIERVFSFFYLDENLDSEGMVHIRHDNNMFPIIGHVKEKSMEYAFIILTLYGRLYYKTRKVIFKLPKMEDKEKVYDLLLDIGKVIRRQSLLGVKRNKLKCEEFYKDFQEFISMAVMTLGHEYDEIDHLTVRYSPKSAEKLKNIREVYESISFEGGKIKYFDYIEESFQIIPHNNAVLLQYMIMNLYIKAYAESVLWLEANKPAIQWCPTTPWQVLQKLEMIIYGYFLH